jgi:hypothetical protein
MQHDDELWEELIKQCLHKPEMVYQDSYSCIFRIWAYRLLALIKIRVWELIFYFFILFLNQKNIV